MKSSMLRVKAVPNAPRDEVQGWIGDSLKVRVHAPPTDGKANERLCAFIAGKLSLPRAAVTLASGASSREKRLAVAGLSEQEVRERLARHCSP
jgi:uncharacterized protein (TIGR00251 family)